MILIVSCKQKETKKSESIDRKPTNELKVDTEKKIEKITAEEQKTTNANSKSNSEFEIRVFDQNLVQQLYNELKSNFEIGFTQKHLNSALIGLKISELKKGKEFEKEMLFENFKCECYDNIKISYSENRYRLWIYEEFYEKDLDWCPESNYSYSFTIANDKITDLKLDFMAG